MCFVSDLKVSRIKPDQTTKRTKHNIWMLGLLIRSYRARPGRCPCSVVLVPQSGLTLTPQTFSGLQTKHQVFLLAVAWTSASCLCKADGCFGGGGEEEGLGGRAGPESPPHNDGDHVNSTKQTPRSDLPSRHNGAITPMNRPRSAPQPDGPFSSGQKTLLSSERVQSLVGLWSTQTLNIHQPGAHRCQADS